MESSDEESSEEEPVKVVTNGKGKKVRYSPAVIALLHTSCSCIRCAALHIITLCPFFPTSAVGVTC